MSTIREAIAAQLEEVRAEERRVHEQHNQLLDRIQQLEDLDRQAAELDEEVPASSPPATPAPPRRKRSTPAGRRPAPRKASRPAGEAHTASGASTGGRRAPGGATALREQLLTRLAKGPASKAELAHELDVAMHRVRDALEALERDGKVKPTGELRQGKHGGRPSPVMALNETRVADSRKPSTPAAEPSDNGKPDNPIDKLLERVVAYLGEHGARDRDDIRADLGNPFEEELSFALGRGVTLKRLEKVGQGGRVVYRNRVQKISGA